MLALELPHDRRQLRAALRERHARPESADEPEVVELARPIHVAENGRQVQGGEDLGLRHGWKEERRRQDTDDRPRAAAQVDGLADDRAVAAEYAAPHPEAEDERRI